MSNSSSEVWGKSATPRAYLGRVPLPPNDRDANPNAIRLLTFTGNPMSRSMGRSWAATWRSAWNRSFPTVATPRWTVRVSHPRAKKSIRSSVFPMDPSLPRSWAEGSSLASMALAMVCKAFEVSSRWWSPGSE